MNLDYELDHAMCKGTSLFEVLNRARTSGFTRQEAEQAMLKLIAKTPEDLKRDGNEYPDIDYALDALLVTQNACRPEQRIWIEN